MKVVCSQIWNRVLALKKLSDRLDEMQISSGRPLAIVCLKENVFITEYMFLSDFILGVFWRRCLCLFERHHVQENPKPLGTCVPSCYKKICK